MRKACLAVTAAALLVLGAVRVVRVHTRDALQRQVGLASAAERALPQRILWVWERPEDLRGIDSSTGIAVLEETLRIGSAVTAIPRRQPLALPAGTVRLAVVRIEPAPGFAPHRADAALLADVVAHLARVARRPGIAALQIDFDARRSEHDFYRRLLTALRLKMPAGLPLEMTALASWCDSDDWIADLPVNGATPMFFRMEPDRRLRSTRAAAYRVSEPLCRGSVGVSTTEPWPQDITGRRMYLFPDRGWKQDFAMIPNGSHEVRP